jgi:hypothetical protein
MRRRIIAPSEKRIRTLIQALDAAGECVRPVSLDAQVSLRTARASSLLATA